MAKLLFPVLQFFESDGTPLSGGKIWTKVTGTSTNKTTYKNAAGSQQHTNPIELDGNGRPDSEGIWLDTDVAYRFIIESTIGGSTKTYDNIVGVPNPFAAAYLSKSLILSDGDGLLDSNSNEVLTVDGVTSAVNYIEAVNSATGNAVKLTAKGDDTSVDLVVEAKGANGDFGWKSRGNTIYVPQSAPSVGQFVYASDTDQLAFGALTGLARGQRDGCIMSTAADTDHDITISAGSRRDSTDVVTMVLGSAMTKRIDAAWAAGTGNGGLSNSVSLTGNAWYHYFLISNTDGDVDVVIDTDISCTNGLVDTGYDYYRYIGSQLTDGSANILAQQQIGDMFYFKTPILDLNTTTLSTSASAITVSVPGGYEHHVLCNAMMTNSSATAVYLRSASATDQAPATNATPLGHLYCGAGLTVMNQVQFFTSTASGAFARADNSSTTLRLATIGYRNMGL